jgi:hypothetical protein
VCRVTAPNQRQWSRRPAGRKNFSSVIGWPARNYLLIGDFSPVSSHSGSFSPGCGFGKACFLLRKTAPAGDGQLFLRFFILCNHLLSRFVFAPEGEIGNLHGSLPTGYASSASRLMKKLNKTDTVTLFRLWLHG